MSALSIRAMHRTLEARRAALVRSFEQSTETLPALTLFIVKRKAAARRRARVVFCELTTPDLFAAIAAAQGWYGDDFVIVERDPNAPDTKGE